MPFQQFRPSFVNDTSINNYELIQLKPEIAQFLREAKNDDVLGLILAHFNYPVTERIPGLPISATQLVISLGIQNVLGIGVNTDLTRKFETEGWIVLREDGTDNKFQVRIAQRDSTEPYEYRFIDPAIIDQWRDFNRNRTGFDNLILELWDEDPTAEPTPEPLAPTTAITDKYEWQEVLHDALQHLASNQMPILRERVFPDVLPLGVNSEAPHLVWYQTGQVYTTAVEGEVETGIRVTLDFRSMDRLEAIALRKSALSYLRGGRIIERVVNTTALYDFETKMRREIVDVIIPPRIDPQKSNLTRLSPWASPWGHQFG